MNRRFRIAAIGAGVERARPRPDGEHGFGKGAGRVALKGRELIDGITETLCVGSCKRQPEAIPVFRPYK